MTETPASYNPGYAEPELQQRWRRQKILNAIAKLERLGITRQEIFEVLQRSLS